MAKITLTVNGKATTLEVEPQTLLAELLRDTLRLTGTHIGCDTSQCGACTVHARRSLRSKAARCWRSKPRAVRC